MTAQSAGNVTGELGRIMQAFFRSVSFEEGERPAYGNLFDLFVVDGKLIKNSGPSPEILTVPQFISPRQAMIDDGELTSFYEAELAHVTEIFGNVAHRFDSYEKRGMTKAGPIAGTGVISTQFIHTPDGWKISSMAWDDERPGLTIPDRYRSGLED